MDHIHLHPHRSDVSAFNWSPTPATVAMVRHDLIAKIMIAEDTAEYTGDEFFEQYKDSLHCEAKHEGVGTFYLYYSHLTSDGARWWMKLALQTASNMVYSTKTPLFASERIPGCRMSVIDTATFLVDNSLLKTNDRWCGWTYQELHPQTVAAMTNHLCHLSGLHTSIHKTGLAQIHQTAESDFSLKSEDGKEVKVHKTVLEGLWPFFRGMVESKMKEVTQKCVKLPIPKSTLDVLVRYFYGEALELELEDAANLIVAAQMYDLPELLEIATTKVESEEMEMAQAVYVWQKSFEAQNEDLRDHASKRIEALMPDTENFDDSIQHLAKKQLVCLLQDISTAMSSKRRKVK